VRRFGWSNIGLEDAQACADERTRDALERILAGEKLPRRDRKLSYNGADGVPIREEIVSEHGDVIVSRNIYGALCLNTPDVLFGDIDADEGGRLKTGWKSAAALATAVVTVVIFIPAGIARMAAIIAVFVVWAKVMLDRQKATRAVEKEERMAAIKKRVEDFMADRPEWRLNLYRTPAGLRVLALHRTFDPHESEVTAFFDTLECDPVYARMCRKQHCFRARVSPKPWRIGIRPRPAIWPVAEDRLPARRDWIAKYETAARSHASCRFLVALGSGPVDPKAAAVLELHDRLCRSGSDLPTA